MSFAKGCHPPDPEKLASHPDAEEHPHVRARLAAHASGAAPLPPSADKLPLVDRLDQGQSGSCTWGSSSACVYQACTSLGLDIGGIPSQQAGYSETLAEERRKATPPGQDLPPLQDVGADLEDVWVVYASEGVRPMKCTLTPDGRRYDIWTDADTGGHPPGNVTSEPDPQDLEESVAVRVVLDVAPHTIDGADPAMSDKMAAALSADPPIPIEIAGFVDTAFENLQPGQVAQPPDVNDPNGGGHALRLSAYRPSAAHPGEREFKVENSWGTSWCEVGYLRADGVKMPGGFCWASEAWCRALWARYVVNPRVLRSPLTTRATDPAPADEETPTKPDSPGSLPPVLSRVWEAVVEPFGYLWPPVATGLGSAALVLLALWALSCTPSPVPAPGPDADAQSAPEAGPLPPPAPAPTTSTCADACARLASFGCPGGADPNCPAAYTLIDQRGIRRKPSGPALTCADVAGASTKSAIVVLGLPCP